MVPFIVFTIGLGMFTICIFGFWVALYFSKHVQCLLLNMTFFLLLAIAFMVMGIGFQVFTPGSNFGH